MEDIEMKKRYYSPAIEVVPIVYKHVLMAGSPQGEISNETTDVAFGREYDFDDEEEEY
jgi:hypothetical protein